MEGIYRRVLGAMSGFSDINVEIVDEVVPHWDIQKKTVRMPPCISFCEDEDEEFLVARGIVVHEGSHVIFCPSTKKKIDSFKEEQDKKEWAELFNVFVDCNNEWKVAEVFPHLRETLGEKTEILLKSKQKDMQKIDHPFVQVLLRCDKLVNWEKVGWEIEYPDDYNPDLKNFVEETVKAFHKGNMQDVSGEKLMDFTTKIHNNWKKIRDSQKQDTSGLQDLIDRMGDAIAKGDEEEQKKLEEQLNNKQKAKSWFKSEIPKSLVRSATTSDVDGEMSGKSTAEAKEIIRDKQTNKETEGYTKKMDTWSVSDKKCIDKVSKKKPLRSSVGTTPQLW